MWKRVIIEGLEYLIKHHVTGTTHKICLTNMILLWFEDISDEHLLLRCKEMNKLVEASDDVFLGHVWSLVESESRGDFDIVRDIVDNNTGRTLSLQTKLEGFKFRIKFLLALANHNQFYEEVTQPLLTTVCELNKREEQLIFIIKAKDREIEEYKLEGGQISRKAVETEPFDLDNFSLQCSASISVSKSLIATCPSHAFTPHVQDMLNKIATAPKINIKENLVESTVPKRKKLVVTMKSPPKMKKAMYYEDEDKTDKDQDDRNDVDDDHSNNVTIEDVKKEGIQVKQKSKLLSPAKSSQNLRLHRALNNL